MVRRFSVIVFTLVAFFALPATPAAANVNLFIKAVPSSWPGTYTASASATGVAVRWVANGDKLYVKDTASDGRRVGAHFFVAGSSTDGTCYSTLGSGKTGLCDLALTEGRDLDIYLVTCDADTTDCGNEDLWTGLLPIIHTHT